MRVLLPRTFDHSSAEVVRRDVAACETHRVVADAIRMMRIQPARRMFGEGHAAAENLFAVELVVSAFGWADLVFARRWTEGVDDEYDVIAAPSILPPRV
jgi:hypothetical protein